MWMHTTITTSTTTTTNTTTITTTTITTTTTRHYLFNASSPLLTCDSSITSSLPLPSQPVDNSVLLQFDDSNVLIVLIGKQPRKILIFLGFVRIFSPLSSTPQSSLLRTQ